MKTKELINKEITIKKLFGALEQATKVLDKSYTQYDKITKSNVIFDFTYELFEELGGQLRDSDEDIDLMEEYYLYKRGRKNDK